MLIGNSVSLCDPVADPGRGQGGHVGYNFKPLGFSGKVGVNKLIYIQ